MVACATAPPPAPAERCLADRLGTLRNPSVSSPCDAGDPTSCRAGCDRGDATACYVAALKLERQDHEAGSKLYQRGCSLGLAIACTNYGAMLWAGQAASPQAVRCARSLFEKSCAVGERFGCGMVGRLLIEDERRIGDGRTLLERSCADLGGFPCRALAIELEGGALGPADPQRIGALKQRACDTGDADACASTR